MITPNHPIYHAARITIETQSPLTLKADDADPTLDVSLIRDAHDNPIIPGTSIAGVLNHLAQDASLPASLFGKADNKENAPQNDNHASLFRCSFGFVHNAKGQIQKGSLQQTLSTNQDDAILNWLTDNKPNLRDNVKLNEYGTAADSGKFDVTSLPKGTRFTFEIGLASTLDNQTETEDHWQAILSLINSPCFRLGALTHRGYGQVSVVNIQQARFNFVDAEANEIENWANWQAQDWESSHNSNSKKSPQPSKNQLTLNLEAEDFWRIGEGNHSFQNLKTLDREPDAKPYSEKTIVWDASTAHIPKTPQIVVPATSIKGALRHHTLYHLRRHQEDWQGQAITDEHLAPLFGIEGNLKDGKQQGNVGKIIINDIYFTPKNGKEVTTKVMMHNAIDRFTGGTLHGALYSEELVYQGTLPLQITFKDSVIDIDNDLKKAFINALTDLASGQLALGAGSAKGHGYFGVKSDELEKITQRLHTLMGAQQ